MPRISELDERLIKGCILYEARLQHSLKKAYQNMLKAFGDGFMEKERFEYWFNRFSEGNEDFDEEEEKKSSDRPESKPKTFYDLPDDVLRNVLEKSDLIEQLTLRKVSRGLRHLVDTQKVNYRILSCDCYHDHIYVEFNKRGSVYLGQEIEDLDVFQNDYGYDGVKVVKSADYISRAITDLSIALSNPKNQFEQLKIDFNIDDSKNEPASGEETVRKVYKSVEMLLKSSSFKSKNSKISVKNFAIRPAGIEHVVSILRFLKPRFLESISIENSIDINPKMDEMVRMEQWKKAIDVEIYHSPLRISIDHFLHLKRFEVFIGELSIADLIRMRDSLATSPIFESCTIQSDSGTLYDVIEIQNALGLILPNDANSANCLNYRIPDTNTILVFYIDNQSILVEKF